jgi:transcriptional regulator with XRE-family HTH domain
MVLLRRVIGETLRTRRRAQRRTLRDVSASANVSLGYLSEIERGQKEASSELLSSICDALDVPLSDVLDDVTSEVARAESVLAKTGPAEHGQAVPRPVPMLRPLARLDEHRSVEDSMVPSHREAPVPLSRPAEQPLPAPVSLAAARARRDEARRTARITPQASAAA